MKSVNNVIVGVLGIILFAVVPVQAGFIQAVGVTQAGTASQVLPVGNLIINATSSAFVQTNATDFWLAGTDGTANPQLLVTFDLGAKYDVSSLYGWVYNYPESVPGQGWRQWVRSVATFNLSGSADGVNFTPVAASLSLPYPNSDANATVETRAIAATGVQYLRMEVLSSVEGPLGTWLNYGLGEVAFEGTPVPEPGTLLMTGACLLGLLCRGRRKRA